MKKLFFMLFPAMALAVRAGEPWRFRAESEEEKVEMVADLYDECIDVPGMEFFGPLNGYVAGSGIYGVWSITSVKKKSEKEAVIHLSNDLGSETQAVRLTLKNDSVLLFEQTGGTTMKRVVNKKLVKIPQSFTLKIKDIK